MEDRKRNRQYAVGRKREEEKAVENTKHIR
jgi:hypothetical protein